MGVTNMRYLLTAAAAAFLLLPASQKASACGAQHSAEAEAAIVAQAAVPEAATEALAQAIDLSAKEKKEKVEYMKSAAGPEPTVKKPKKKKHKKAKKEAK
jgi:hypothetical protein